MAQKQQTTLQPGARALRLLRQGATGLQDPEILPDLLREAPPPQADATGTAPATPPPPAATAATATPLASLRAPAPAPTDAPTEIIIWYFCIYEKERIKSIIRLLMDQLNQKEAQ